MAWREDSDLEFRLLQQGIPIWRLQNALVIHPVRKASWGVSLKEQKKGMFNALLYKKYPGLYRKKIQPRPGWLKAAEYPAALALDKSGSPKDAIEHYKLFMAWGDANNPDRRDAEQRLRQLGSPYEPER